MKKSVLIAFTMILCSTACEPADDSAYLASFEQPPAPGSMCKVDTSLIGPITPGDGFAAAVWCDDVTPTIYVSKGFPCAFDGPEMKTSVAFWRETLDMQIDVVQDEQWGDPLYGGIYLTSEPVPATEDVANGWAIHQRYTSDRVIHSSKIYMRFCQTELLVHELGHALGFAHSEHADSCLNPGCTQLNVRSSELATMRALRANIRVQSTTN